MPDDEKEFGEAKAHGSNPKQNAHSNKSKELSPKAKDDNFALLKIQNEAIFIC